MINYLLSDLDIAFFALMYESALPELVPDPISRFPPKKVEKMQHEFYMRQQLRGVLDVTGENVNLSESLARALFPIFEGDMALYHLDLSREKIAEYDAAIYISEKFGVSLVQREDKNTYRVMWYPDPDLCNTNFLKGLSLDDIGPYRGQPFKLCGEAAEMDALLSYGHSGNIEKLEDYANHNNIDPIRLADILKNLSDNDDAILIEAGRSERIKPGAIKAKLLPGRQEMFRFIASPEGNLEVFESFSSENLLRQILNFEGR